MTIKFLSKESVPAKVYIALKFNKYNMQILGVAKTKDKADEILKIIKSEDIKFHDHPFSNYPPIYVIAEYFVQN